MRLVLGLGPGLGSGLGRYGCARRRAMRAHAGRAPRMHNFALNLGGLTTKAPIFWAAAAAARAPTPPKWPPGPTGRVPLRKSAWLACVESMFYGVLFEVPFWRNPSVNWQPV